MKSSFEPSQQKLAEKIAVLALGLENPEARRQVLLSAKVCGAEGAEVLEGCFIKDHSEGLRDVLEIWDDAELSFQEMNNAFYHQAAECALVLAEKGCRLASEPLPNDVNDPVLGALQMIKRSQSAWISGTQETGFYTNKQTAAKLMGVLEAAARRGDYHPWEAEEALTRAMRPDAPLDYGGGPLEKELARARLRLAEALLSSGVAFDPDSKINAGVEGTGEVRAAALCLRALIADEETSEASAKVCQWIPWKQLNEDLSETGGLFAALIGILIYPWRGYPGGRGECSLALSQKLMELTGDAPHARPGIFERVFSQTELDLTTFSVSDYRSELIFELMGKTQTSLSERDFVWILETMADKLQRSASGEEDAPRYGAFGADLKTLYDRISRLGVSPANPEANAKDFGLVVMSLINELCNEHDLRLRTLDRQPGGADLSAVAEKTKLAVVSLKNIGVESRPRPRALSI